MPAYKGVAQNFQLAVPNGVSFRHQFAIVGCCCYNEAMTVGQLIMAIFLSLVAMPGAGHWRLGWRMRSYCFMAPTFILFGVILSVVFKLVSAQMENIAKLQKLGTVKMATQMSQNISTQTDDGNMKIITFLLIACYVASIADLIWLYQSQAVLPKK